MTDTALTRWSPREASIIPREVRQPSDLMGYAVQLSPREQAQIAVALEGESYEMASVFVWSKAIAALRRRLSSLGMDLIGQMLGRPDIDEFSSIDHSITDHELIGLASDLGVLSATDALRMKQTQELVTHFASITGSEAESNQMQWEEAFRCIRVSIEAILGHEQIELPHQFVEFRRSLESRSFQPEDPEIEALRVSPEFFKRTTASILLAQLHSAKGAAAEHTYSNVRVIVPALWPGLAKPVRWQVGQTYAELHNAGQAKLLASKALRQALVEVKGFDYVPETLRSTTYSSAAQRVLQAHEGFDNFYNEIPAMRHLASLGTSIPMPAVPSVMTALLAVCLGNGRGISYGAEPVAKGMLAALDKERWTYYLRELLARDKLILAKLHSHKDSQERWARLIVEFNLQEYLPKSKDAVSALVNAGKNRQFKVVEVQAKRLYTSNGP